MKVITAFQSTRHNLQAKKTWWAEIFSLFLLSW